MLSVYKGGDKRESAETLVTSVTKIDAKGWLSHSGPLGRFFDPFASLVFLRWRGFAHPLIQHAEVLRSQVRQEASTQLLPASRADVMPMSEHRVRLSLAHCLVLHKRGVHDASSARNSTCYTQACVKLLHIASLILHTG